MAFTHVAAHGTANSKTSTTTISLSPISTIPVGNIAVIWLACDNRAFIGGGGDSTTFRYPVYDNWVSDTAGNQWISCWGGAPDNVTDTDAEGAIFVVQLTAALTTSDTITVNFLAPRVAKAIELHEFSHDVRNSWSFVPVGGGIRSAGIDPRGFGAVSLRQNSYLGLHVLSAEGPNTDTYTWASGWTQINGDGTTGGADASNIHLRGGYGTFSGSAGAINVTSDTADRDYIEGYVIIAEVDMPETFGECDIVDSGSRADENPLSFGGRWSDQGETTAADPGGVANPGLKLASGTFQVADQTHRDNWDRVYITPHAECNDYELYSTIATIPSDTSTAQAIPLPPTNTGFRGLIIYCRPVGTSFGANGAAYWHRRNRDDPDGFNRGMDHVAITINIQVGLQAHTPINMVDGCKLGLSKRNYELHLWVDRTGSSGWEWIMSYDTQVILAGGSRWFGFECHGSETRIDDFSFCEECFGQQIYRRVFG